MSYICKLKFSKNSRLIKSNIDYGFIPDNVKLAIGKNSPVCRVGDDVIAGQEIISGEGGFYVHSPVCGKITGIDGKYITIAADDREEFVNMPLFSGDILSADRDYVLDYIAASGITVGGTPLFTLLRQKLDVGATRLVINCMECLPGFGSEYRCVAEMTEEVVTGAKLLLSLLGIRTGVFAVEKRKKKLASLIEKQNYPKDMFIISLMPSTYPSDFEAVISDTLFYHTPKEKVLTVTPSLCIQLYDAFVYGIPYVGHTVSFTYKNRCANIYVPEGSLLGDIEEYMFLDGDMGGDEYGYSSSLYAAVNSPLNGYSGNADEIAMTSDISSVVFYRHNQDYSSPEGRCIECNCCDDICPAGVSARLIYSAAVNNNVGAMKLYGFDKCILCGCCSYVCPMNLGHIGLFTEYKSKQGSGAEQNENAHKDQDTNDIKEQSHEDR